MIGGNEWIRIFLHKESEWKFQLFSLLVNGKNGRFCRNSLVKEMYSITFNCSKCRKTIEDFVNKMIANGLIECEDEKITGIGKEKPLRVTDRGREIYLYVKTVKEDLE